MNAKQRRKARRVHLRFIRRAVRNKTTLFGLNVSKDHALWAGSYADVSHQPLTAEVLLDALATARRNAGY